jgi:transcriptional regulator with XRE-family HTH domain
VNEQPSRWPPEAEEAIQEHHFRMGLQMTPAEAVGIRVRLARKAKGLSQERLGEALASFLGKPWSKQVVSAVERGKHDLTVTELLAVATVLDEPVVRLLNPSELTQQVRFAKLEIEGLGVLRYVLGSVPDSASAIVESLTREMNHGLVNTQHWLEQIREQVRALERLVEEGAKQRDELGED